MIARLAGEIDRRPDALKRAGAEQHALVLGDRANQRRSAEEGDAGEEHAATPEQVGGAAAEQEEAGEGERVGVDDPLQPGVGETEAAVDRRQRHVHDRDVEDDHELRQADHDQQGCRATNPH